MFEDHDVPLSILGKSLKCEKDDTFASVSYMKIGDSDVGLFLECPTCGNKWKNVYKFGHFLRMANMALIDKPDIIEFQKQMVVHKGEFIKIENGLEGAFYVEPDEKNLVISEGKKLICTSCHHFYSLTVDKLKKNSVKFAGYCAKCNNKKPKKIKIPFKAVIALGRPGIIPSDIINSVKEDYKDAMKGGYDSSETYSAQDGTLAYHVQERLGMVGETKRTSCYICGAPLAEGAERCPKCGSDTDLDY